MGVRKFSEQDLDLLCSLASAASLRVRNVALAEEAAVANQVGRERTGTKDLELRARAEGDLVGGRQAGALEFGGEQRLHGVTRAGRALAQARAELTEPDRELLGLLFLGKGVASGREVLVGDRKRRRNAPLGVIAINLRRGRLGVSCASGGAAQARQEEERDAGAHDWTAWGVRGRPPRAVSRKF